MNGALRAGTVSGSAAMRCAASQPRMPLLTPDRERGTRDRESTILPDLISHGLLCAFDNGTRYFLDFGTPEGLAKLAVDVFTYQ